jgi:hypothetical protein
MRMPLTLIRSTDLHAAHGAHCEEPPGLAFGEPEDRLRDEAIQAIDPAKIWIASLRSQ